MDKDFDPQLFLSIAKRLVNDTRYDTRGRIRTAIGRSYYAAFLKAKLKLNCRIHDDSRIHAEVRENLVKRKLHYIANKLEVLFNARVDADYHMDSLLQLGDCQKYIKLSENIISLIDEV
jgi:uncharacterized protein (UPF0332 family)